jgi:antitoxin component YwqK of YwqJK toxin-antitoxin module
MRIFLLLIWLVWGCSNPVPEAPLTVEKKYFPSGKIMEIRHFRNGAKNGLQTGFWENGNKRFEYVAVNDACEGELKEWAEDGQLFHLATYKNGREEGVQKMWHADGRIRSNFVLINGRRYGLLGTKNCINENEIPLPN